MSDGTDNGIVIFEVHFELLCFVVERGIRACEVNNSSQLNQDS